MGLGTAYERWSLYRLLARWTDGRRVGTALEGPVDGVAGMPGLHLLPLALRGTRVTVAHESRDALGQVERVYWARGLTDRLELVTVTGNEPLRDHDRAFDLVLSFNALPLVASWRAYLESLFSCCAGLLFIVVTNPDSYGARLCRLLSRRGSSVIFDHEATRQETLVAEITRRGRVLSSTHVDCPWWPDLFVPAGQTLLGATVGRMPLAHLAPVKPSFTCDADTFPFAGDATCPAELAAAMRWHPAFDGYGPRLGALFGHHTAYLVERTD